jgi:hypothetical protein
VGDTPSNVTAKRRDDHFPDLFVISSRDTKEQYAKDGGRSPRSLCRRTVLVSFSKAAFST